MTSRSAEHTPASGSPVSRIFIDLTDVYEHAIWHTTCAGIPRVQLEVASALVRSNPNVIPFSLHKNVWRDLRSSIKAAAGDSDSLFLNLHERSAYMREYPCWHDLRQLFRLAKGHVGTWLKGLMARRPLLTQDDTLFIGGAFWMNRDVMKLCERAAAQGTNLIVLFHDLIPLTHPQFTGHDFSGRYADMLRLPAHFIVTTPFNQAELERVRAEIVPGAQTSVSVVLLAHEFPGAKRNERGVPVSKRLEKLAGRPFALCVGTVEIRKNHLLLLAVWNELTAELGDALPILVIAGRRGWKVDAVLRKLDAACETPGSRVVFVEGPDDCDLRWLYSAADFTVFPSLFEGWGLPVGESFWFGKACAASNTSSIPTVGRDLCVYFSPEKPEEMKAAIRLLLDPAVRQSWEAKIAAAPLRIWADVAHDIEKIILQRAAASGEGRAAAPALAPTPDARAHYIGQPFSRSQYCSALTRSCSLPLKAP
ncbi:MAG: glycosyltransferase family 4 protein [Methylovirgula sp.]